MAALLLAGWSMGPSTAICGNSGARVGIVRRAIGRAQGIVIRRSA